MSFQPIGSMRPNIHTASVPGAMPYQNAGYQQSVPYQSPSSQYFDASMNGGMQQMVFQFMSLMLMMMQMVLSSLQGLMGGQPGGQPGQGGPGQGQAGQPGGGQPGQVDQGTQTGVAGTGGGVYNNQPVYNQPPNNRPPGTGGYNNNNNNNGGYTVNYPPANSNDNQVCEKEPPPPPDCEEPPPPPTYEQPPPPPREKPPAKPPQEDLPRYRGGTTGRVWGDPHFRGFDNEKYDVKGENGKVYNILDDQGVMVNARFNNFNNGSVIGATGIQVGNHNIEFSADGSLGAPAKIDGRAMRSGQRYDLGNGQYAIWRPGKLEVHTREYTIRQETIHMAGANRNNINMDIVMNGDVFRDNVRPDGLLGITADGQGRQNKPGDYRDYQIMNNSLFGDDYRARQGRDRNRDRNNDPPPRTILV